MVGERYARTLQRAEHRTGTSSLPCPTELGELLSAVAVHLIVCTRPALTTSAGGSRPARRQGQTQAGQEGGRAQQGRQPRAQEGLAGWWVERLRRCRRRASPGTLASVGGQDQKACNLATCLSQWPRDQWNRQAKEMYADEFRDWLCRKSSLWTWQRHTAVCPAPRGMYSCQALLLSAQCCCLVSSAGLSTAP